MNLMFLTWFWSGRFPVAPGTAGSVAALPFAYGMLYFSNAWVLGVVTLVVLVIGCFLSISHVRETATKDPSYIVIDEVVGQWIPLLVVGYDWRLWAIAFVTFRFFDITKVWPACWIDGVSPQASPEKKGMAIMFDDVVAGMYALGVILLIQYMGIFS